MGKKTQQPDSQDCIACGAQCCRYIALEIDKPTCKRDYDHIRWYLLHRNVHVFVDFNGDWYLEFETPCEALEPDMRCGNYRDRPRICRKHGDAENECEYFSGEDPYKHRFSTVRAYERWLEKKGKKWRWKA